MVKPVSHDLLIGLADRESKKQIVVSFRLFLNHFERIANPKGEPTSELCFTGLNKHDISEVLITIRMKHS